MECNYWCDNWNYSCWLDECPGECADNCEFCFSEDDCMGNEGDCEYAIDSWTDQYTGEIYEYSYCHEPYVPGGEEFWEATNCDDCLTLGGTW